MKRFSFLLFFLASIGMGFPMRVVFAAPVCACTTINGDCRSVYIPPTEQSESACKSACKTQLGTEMSTSKFETDTAGEALSQICAQTHQTYLDTAKNSTGGAPASQAQTGNKKAFITPSLNIDIPTVKFSDPIAEGSVVKSNFIADYLNGVYEFLLGTGLTIVIVMVMIGGLQYVLGAASPNQVGEGKKRIINAVTGLVLLLCAFIILKTTNPQLVLLKLVKLENIAEVQIPEELTHGIDEVADVPDSTGTADTASVKPGKQGKKHKESSGQSWTIPGTSYTVTLSKEDVCAMSILGSSQAQLNKNITTVKLAGSTIKVHKFIAKDLQDRFNAIMTSTDPAVIKWRTMMSQEQFYINGKGEKKSYNPVNGSGGWMAEGHGKDIAYIKQYGGAFGISAGSGSITNAARSNYIKYLTVQKTGSTTGTYVDKNNKKQKNVPSPHWFARSPHALGTGFDLDYPHNSSKKSRNEYSIPVAVGNIIEATGKFVWLLEDDPAHIEYAPSYCNSVK